MKTAARVAYPLECCGLLLGEAVPTAGSLPEVAAVVPTENAGARGRSFRFEISPRDFLEAQSRADRGGLLIFGCYHSHVGARTSPSDDDSARAWPRFLYLILPSRPADGAPRAFEFLGAPDHKKTRELPVRSVPPCGRGGRGGTTGIGRGSVPKVSVHLPSNFAPFAGDRRSLVLEGATVAEVLEQLRLRHPELASHLFGSDRRLRRSVSLFLNDDDVRNRQRESTPTREGDVLSIVPALAGGSGDRRTRGTRSRPPALSTEELRRYSRHLLLPEVGRAGQLRLRRARVLLVGAGGLGSPAALYLAAAGVGTIGLVDDDTVDPSNLQRQVLYSTRDIGRSKLPAATARLTGLNPGVKVVAHPHRLDSSNALRLFRQYDVVVDGSDNFPTRYLVNDACVLTGRPDVYGSIYRFEGQVSVFDARHGPCYRCLYPEPPPAELVPSCAEAGVLGVLPGVVGTLQATEALKVLLGAGEPLYGRLLLYDALSLKFRELALRKNPSCALCSARATQKGLIDYPAFCGVEAPSPAKARRIPEIEPEELRAALRSRDPPLLVDVREPAERLISRIDGALEIPQREIVRRTDELARAPSIVLFCRAGIRSAQAARALLDLGFAHVRSLKGGINAWAERVDPSLAVY